MIPLVKFAAEYKLNNKIAARASATWKNTSKIKTKSKEAPNSSSEVRLKDSLGLGVGLTYYIS